jgi:hypothetical protein
LPQSTLELTLETTKIIVKKGIYAEYAEKYLHLQNVPLENSITWMINSTKIEALTEADPLSYYTLIYKTYPDNLNRLFSLSDKGVILDFTNSWKNTGNFHLENDKADSLNDPRIYKSTIIEKTDTFYKTIVTDSSFRRIPVIKKQILAKTVEDEANETAKLILKIRKSKIDLLRGKLTYPPDGEALKLNLEELDKLENIYLTMFVGMRFQEKRTQTFYVTPRKEQVSVDLCYFSADKGIQSQPLPGNRLITLQLTKLGDNTPAMTVPVKAQNALYFRVPVTVNATIRISNDILASERIPVYQFGFMQTFPLKP